MTITAKLGTNRVRLENGVTFEMDKSDIRSLVIDYTGELGSDTVSTVTATTTDITAGTPSISSNVVTISLSGGSENATAKVDVEMTTAAGDVISRIIYVRVRDF